MRFDGIAFYCVRFIFAFPLNCGKMHAWNAQGECVIHSITEFAVQMEEVLNHKKLDFPSLFLQLDWIQGLAALSLPLHLYLTLYLDRDRDCHLGRLQGADCSVAEQTSLIRQNADVPFWQSRREALNPVTPNKGVCPLSVTRSVKHLPQILPSSLHKQDKTAVRVVLKLMYALTTKKGALL